MSHHDWWMSGLLERLDAPEVHDFSKVGYALGLAKLRVDGFASMEASRVREGIVVTRPFLSDGTALAINAKVEEGGSIDVEAADGTGKVIPGCSRRDCDTFRGDRVRHLVTWKGNALVARSAETPFRKLHFFLRKASLFSFQMCGEKTACGPGRFPGTGWGIEGDSG